MTTSQDPYRTAILLGISEPQVTELINQGELELYLPDADVPLIVEKSIYQYMERRDSATTQETHDNNALLNKQLRDLKTAIAHQQKQLEIHDLTTEQRLVELEKQVTEIAPDGKDMLPGFFYTHIALRCPTRHFFLNKNTGIHSPPKKTKFSQETPIKKSFAF